VTLVAILDADKEGFLRSQTSLIQTIGRAARNVDGRVVMYADTVTESMRRAISETQRRRMLQIQHNLEHGINPTTVRKAVKDILAYLRKDQGAPVPERLTAKASQRERQVGKRRVEAAELPHADLERLIRTLEDEMHEASADLRFEYAARLRDEIKELKRELREVSQIG
jgi:excinuclease ABC subunit B